jgi:hypothetical protein
MMPTGLPAPEQMAAENTSQGGMDEQRRRMLVQMLGRVPQGQANPWAGAAQNVAQLATMFMPANGGQKTL